MGGTGTGTLASASSAASAVLASARRALRDTFTPYRWSDAALLAILNDGLRELYAARPDVLVGPGGRALAPADLSAATATLPVSARWIGPLASFVALRGWAEGEESANPAEIQPHERIWREALYGAGR